MGYFPHGTRGKGRAPINIENSGLSPRFFLICCAECCPFRPVPAYIYIIRLIENMSSVLTSCSENMRKIGIKCRFFLPYRSIVSGSLCRERCVEFLDGFLEFSGKVNGFFEARGHHCGKRVEFLGRGDFFLCGEIRVVCFRGLEELFACVKIGLLRARELVKQAERGFCLISDDGGFHGSAQILY